MRADGLPSVRGDGVPYAWLQKGGRGRSFSPPASVAARGVPAVVGAGEEEAEAGEVAVWRRMEAEGALRRGLRRHSARSFPVPVAISHVNENEVAAH